MTTLTASSVTGRADGPAKQQANAASERVSEPVTALSASEPVTALSASECWTHAELLLLAEAVMAEHARAGPVTQASPKSAGFSWNNVYRTIISKAGILYRVQPNVGAAYSPLACQRQYLSLLGRLALLPASIKTSLKQFNSPGFAVSSELAGDADIARTAVEAARSHRIQQLHRELSKCHRMKVRCRTLAAQGAAVLASGTTQASASSTTAAAAIHAGAATPAPPPAMIPMSSSPLGLTGTAAAAMSGTIRAAVSTKAAAAADVVARGDTAAAPTGTAATAGGTRHGAAPNAAENDAAATRTPTASTVAVKTAEQWDVHDRMMDTWKSIWDHRLSGIFQHPVTEEEAPQYSDYVKEPMDFSTIKARLDTGEIKTPLELHRLFSLTFANCLAYNDRKTPFARHAIQLDAFHVARMEKNFPDLADQLLLCTGKPKKGTPRQRSRPGTGQKRRRGTTGGNSDAASSVSKRSRGDAADIGSSAGGAV